MIVQTAALNSREPVNFAPNAARRCREIPGNRILQENPGLQPDRIRGRRKNSGLSELLPRRRWR